MRALGLIAAAAAVATACSSSDDAPSQPTTGAAIYKASCQTCHNRHGEGFVGPSLIDISVRYPNVADQVDVVTFGKAKMPGFSGQLTAAQIATVVDYTRTEFATHTLESDTTTTVFIGPTAPAP